MSMRPFPGRALWTSDALFTFTAPDGADRIQFLAELGGVAVTATPEKGANK